MCGELRIVQVVLAEAFPYKQEESACLPPSIRSCFGQDCVAAAVAVVIMKTFLCVDCSRIAKYPQLEA